MLLEQSQLECLFFITAEAFTWLHVMQAAIKRHDPRAACGLLFHSAWYYLGKFVILWLGIRYYVIIYDYPVQRGPFKQESSVSSKNCRIDNISQLKMIKSSC